MIADLLLLVICWATITASIIATVWFAIWLVKFLVGLFTGKRLKPVALKVAIDFEPGVTYLAGRNDPTQTQYMCNRFHELRIYGGNPKGNFYVLKLCAACERQIKLEEGL